jgi:3-methyl-2-oxobutanoate hydroxymethyltransferase
MPEKATAPRPKVTIRDFQKKKEANEKLVLVSAYDALFGRLADEGGVDAVLVGDSVGNVIAGFDSTVQVTLDQMIYHGAAVRRGVQHALLVVDMPFLTYHTSPTQAIDNCARVMRETNAQAVKLEGGTARVSGSVAAVVDCGIPVMGHIGFTPQSVHALGGFRVQGKTEDSAARLLDDARRLEDAGAFAVVLELVPSDVASRVTKALSIPTIGIGAGADCSGQVLVLPDLLGLTDRFTPKYLKRYAKMADEVRDAVRRFGDEVRGGEFPDEEHGF